MQVHVTVPNTKAHADILEVYQTLKMVRRKAHEVTSAILAHPQFETYCVTKGIYAPVEVTSECLLIGGTQEQTIEYFDSAASLSSCIMMFINKELDVKHEGIYTQFFVNKFFSVVEPLVQALDLKNFDVASITLDESDLMQLSRIQSIDYTDIEKKMDVWKSTSQVILDGYKSFETKSSLWKFWKK